MASESNHGVPEGEGVASSSTATGVDVTPSSPVGSTQGSSAPALGPAFAILQKLEDALRWTATVVSHGVGRYHDMLSFVEESLEELRCVGGPSLARRCEWELHLLEGLMYRLEGLVHANSESTPLVMSALFEHEDLVKQILRQEALLRRLHRQHCIILAKMDAYLDAAFFMDVGSLEGEAGLKRLEREKARVGRATEAEARTLQLLRQKEEDGEASLARLQ